MPWGVECPHGDHKISDCFDEPFHRADRSRLISGQAAMVCPTCGGTLTFPQGYRAGPVAGADLPVIYWSKAIWDTFDPDRKDYCRLRVPNVEQLLQ
jgi:hypothetical protein